jgi:hypothetical protein
MISSERSILHSLNSSPPSIVRNQASFRIIPVCSGKREKLGLARQKSPNYSRVKALMLIDGKNSPLSRELFPRHQFPNSPFFRHTLRRADK